jgi:aryl-alcohol dehydrogenase-like predicted oxidoreductase
MAAQTAGIGLGCMRLSTAADRDEARAVAVIHAALNAGARLLDTSDAYCHDERDTGHNERLIARAGDVGRRSFERRGGDEGRHAPAAAPARGV